MIYNNSEGEYGKYIIQELQDPQAGTPEFREMYKRFSHRILWIDDKVCPGSFQMNTAWYYAVPEKDPVFEEHVHDDDEIIGFLAAIRKIRIICMRKLRLRLTESIIF